MKPFLTLPAKAWFLTGLSLSLLLSVTPAFATGTPPKVNWVAGPKVVNLGGDLAALKLSDRYIYANAEDTQKLMEFMGNPPSRQDIGLVVPKKEADDWMVVFSYNPLGYVKDDDASSIDKDALLRSITESTEEDNKKRRAQGVSTLEIVGWQEEPHYDAQTHNLIWAISATSEGKKIVNYNTRKLGRGGVTSINLVVTPDRLANAKPELETLIANYDYSPGRQYSDFVPGKDKAAEIGLTALIAGGAGAAAVKTGFFAKFFLPILLALKKLWIVAIGALIAVFKSIGGKKSKPDVDTSPDINPTEPKE